LHITHSANEYGRHVYKALVDY